MFTVVLRNMLNFKIKIFSFHKKMELNFPDLIRNNVSFLQSHKENKIKE